MTEEEKQSKDDIKFMKEAKKQAMKAYALKEVPIGCVITCEGKIIARGYNQMCIRDSTSITTHKKSIITTAIIDCIP